MRIGIIRPLEIEYNPDDVKDLEEYIKLLGHEVAHVYVDHMFTSLSKNGIRVFQLHARDKIEEVEIDGGLLRHLGIIKDFEQFMCRIWSIHALELNGVYIMNPVIPWLIASDKFSTLLILSKHGIPIPETLISENFLPAYKFVEKFGECVIKPLRSAMGFGVFKIDNKDFAYYVFSYLMNLSKPIYIQKFLKSKINGDYRIIVVGNEVIGAVLRIGKDWKHNVAQGAKTIPVKLSNELQELSIKVVEILKLDYAGIDIIETNDGHYVIEVNPTLSWQGFKKATGTNPAYYIVKYLIDKIKK